MLMLAFTAAFALGACATALPQIVERPGGGFAVRYDATAQTPQQADAAANAHCAGGAANYVAEETRFDGFTYRTYRCALR